jgi:site-specific DNA recombinase
LWLRDGGRNQERPLRLYDHCTGYKGKCPEPYVREEVISEKFSKILGRLCFGDEVLQWINTALRDSHTDEKKEHEAAIIRLRAEYDRLQNRLYAMYIDKLDGRIDHSLFAQMSEQWRFEQDKLQQEITVHRAADQSYLDEGVGLLELASRAQRLFAKQEPGEHAGCSISYFRTPHGKVASWPRRSVSLLILLRKRLR